MGQIYICKCKDCGYTLTASLGLGMMYSSEKDDEIKKMKIGCYGDQGRNFFENHPDGSITCNHVVSKCTSCGNLESVYDFDLLIPNPELIPQKQMVHQGVDKDHKYMRLAERSVRSLPENIRYVLYEKYDHACSVCGSKAEIIDDFVDELRQKKIICPKCGGSMHQFRYLLWD